MRITILIWILCLGCFLSEANNPSVINERFENQQLKRVFKKLKQKYGLKIAFSDRLVSDKQITVSGYVKDGLSLKEVEKKLLASLPKGFSLKNNVKVREQDRNNEPAQDNQVKLHNSLNNF